MRKVLPGGRARHTSCLVMSKSCPDQYGILCHVEHTHTHVLSLSLSLSLSLALALSLAGSLARSLARSGKRDKSVFSENACTKRDWAKRY